MAIIMPLMMATADDDDDDADDVDDNDDDDNDDDDDDDDDDDESANVRCRGRASPSQEIHAQVLRNATLCTPRP